MNQKIQLYIENEQVDVFQDGSINIVSSIKDFREPDKIFTDFSRNFNLPATSRNNKFFKHYYNYDLVGNNFDARSSKEARIEINDRPYKDGKKLSQAMRIMGFMKNDYHIDEDLFEIFVTSGVYKKYAEKHVTKNQIDEVDELSVLAKK